ncbi:MAG: biopolymer transporter ExbD [Candidatus Wallbacteria bacterium]|nr:biopolymer transporter ExbD [Candidatus Wallbacteria bacterium]
MIKLSYLDRNRHSAYFITPLIDILFILIIFFVLTGSFNSLRTLRVNPPEAVERKDTQPSPDTLLVQIDSQGSLLLADTPVTVDTLKTALNGRKVTIAVDRCAPFGAFAQVFDLAAARAQSLEIVYLQE